MNKNLPRADGELAILNVGDGDTKLSFDPKNPAERIRAARIVKDMLRRGYALLVQMPDGSFQRAIDFDENVCEYIIADFDPITAAQHDEQEEQNGGHEQGQGAETAPQGGTAAAAPRGRKPKTRGIPAEGARAVSVARVSGG